MTARNGVKGEGPRIIQKLVVGTNSSFARSFSPIVLPSQNVDMTWHMVHVPGVGTERCERVGGFHRPFGLVRHFHRVDQEMGDRGMLWSSGRLGQCDRPFADGNRLDHVRAARRPPRFDIP